VVPGPSDTFVDELVSVYLGVILGKVSVWDLSAKHQKTKKNSSVMRLCEGWVEDKYPKSFG